MAPWAHDNVRLELRQVKAPLDIYPLGKVLWSMISGRNGFPFWEYEEDANNLERTFRTIRPCPSLTASWRNVWCEKEKDCSLSFAQELRSAVDDVIAQIDTLRGYRPDGAQSWPCRVCGRGNYQNGGQSHEVKGYREDGPWDLKNITLEVYVCDYCGHAELFGKYPSKRS
jgi:hypothetical protein